MSDKETKLANYIRQRMLAVGKSDKEIETIISTVSKLKFMQSESAIDAFIKASL